jgi:hypothetical protein
LLKPSPPFCPPSLQMKRSLEKLQQGIPVPEVQQDSPPPPPTERHPDP